MAGMDAQQAATADAAMKSVLKLTATEVVLRAMGGALTDMQREADGGIDFDVGGVEGPDGNVLEAEGVSRPDSPVDELNSRYAMLPSALGRADGQAVQAPERARFDFQQAPRMSPRI
mmetsp:Transcript_73748/g.130819  ORF Transcript_73748/g.130819 Transcript_73748/m.130819 type:complete len:117 (+) Transcript_73748:61-411(+)